MSNPTSSIRLIRRLRLTKICRARSICGRSRGVDNSRESSESDKIFCARRSASDAGIRVDAGPRVWTKTREDLAETEPGERSDRGNLPLHSTRDWAPPKRASTHCAYFGRFLAGSSACMASSVVVMRRRRSQRPRQPNCEERLAAQVAELEQRIKLLEARLRSAVAEGALGGRSHRGGAEDPRVGDRAATLDLAARVERARGPPANRDRGTQQPSPRI